MQILTTGKDQKPGHLNHWSGVPRQSNYCVYHPQHRSAQKHFRWTIVGPDSSYSFLEIHICWNVLKEERMEPPIQTEYLRSGGATTLIFIVEGAKAVSSLVMRSPIPVNIVVPPDRTTFAYKSLRMSKSHFMIDWKVVSWMPLFSLSELSLAAFISISKSRAM